jgi:hypothetical protein
MNRTTLWRSNMEPDPNLSVREPPLLEGDLLRSLKWSVFDPVETIQVREAQTGPEGLTHSPFFQGQQEWHPVAGRPVTNPPVTSMKIVVDAVDAWDYWHDADDMASCPQPFLVRKEGHQSFITVLDFVRAIHNYCSSISEIMYDCFDDIPESGVKFWFEGCLGPGRSQWQNNDNKFSIIIETGQE